MKRTFGFPPIAKKISGLACLLGALLVATHDAAADAFVNAYSNMINNVEYGLTPADVQVTSDGGYIALALTQSPSAVGVNWLLRLDASGDPLWQRQIGCASGAPGDYAYGLSAQQSSDGGYIVGGGILGCGASIQRSLVEKLDARGRVAWALAYPAGAGGSAITQIRQTSDGGYIAVGSATSAGQHTGALILKLNGRGTVQWQRALGLTGSTQAYFNAVQQTADGGYVATGEFYLPGSGIPFTSVLVVAFDSSGNVRWQHGFNNLDHGSPGSYVHALSLTQTSEGGFLVAGSWTNSRFPGQGAAGALLLELDSGGNIAWQKAYSGGVYCYFNGFSEVCTDIGGVVYSVQQSADGSYILAGDGDLELSDSVPLVPWMAKVDSGGNLRWQYFYYDAHQPTGRPLSQYFASSTLTNDGGFMALGFTENYDNGEGELYAVKTDGAGLVGGCGQIHSATPLSAIDPALATLAPSLPVQATVTAGIRVQTVARSTAITLRGKCQSN